MNEDFITFEIAKKLKEKGFNCELPYAMYNEIGQFCLLTTSAPYHVCESGYKYREYYDYNDFDKNDFIAPTISQVLKWLRNQNIYVEVSPAYNEITFYASVYKAKDAKYIRCYISKLKYASYEQAALAGIEYVLDNLI